MRSLDDQPIDCPPYALETDGRLRHADGHVDMLPRRLALPLKVLMEARGRTVTKEALINRCWPRAEINEQSLARAIADLRKMFKRHGQDPIKTVYGVGYRFDASVRADSLGEEAADQPKARKADLFHQEAMHRIHIRRARSLDVAERLLKEAAELRAEPTDWLAIAQVHVHRMQLGYAAVTTSWPDLRSAAERAMQGSAADALSLLALGLCWAHWDFSAAEEMLERARQIAPNSYIVNRCAGLKEQMVGNNALAVSYFRRASESNPLALPVSASLIITLATEGKSNDAFAEVQQMVGTDADSPLTLGFRALAETRLGDPALAVTPAKQAFEALPDSALFAAILAYALAATGQKEPARELLESPSVGGEPFEHSTSLACWAWLCMDNPSRALNTLHYSLERRCPFLPVILRDPMMAPISEDRRFRAVFEAVFAESHPSVFAG